MNNISPPPHAVSLRRVSTKFAHSVMLAAALLLAVPALANAREVKQKVSPTYPEIAKRLKVSGQVKVAATVNADGKVTSAKALSGNHMLTTAAEEAVRQWRFVSGEGDSTVEVEIIFAAAQ